MRNTDKVRRKKMKGIIETKKISTAENIKMNRLQQ